MSNDRKNTLNEYKQKINAATAEYDLKQPITDRNLTLNHNARLKMVLEQADRDLKKGFLSQEEYNKKLKELIGQHQRWKEIMKISISHNAKPQPHPTLEANHSNIKNYLESWKAIIDSMPDISEKNLLQQKLNDIHSARSKNLGDEIISGLAKQLEDAFSPLAPLFIKIDTLKTLHTLQLEGATLLAQWDGVIMQHETTTDARRQIYEGYRQSLASALKTTNPEKITTAINAFKEKIMQDIEHKIAAYDKNKIEKKAELINRIESKLEILNDEKHPFNAKHKQPPTYLIHKINALNATVSYLKNECSKKELDTVLRDNKGYDRAAPFSRSVSKNLIAQAYNFKGDPFPNSKAVKKDSPNDRAAPTYSPKTWK